MSSCGELLRGCGDVEDAVPKVRAGDWRKIADETWAKLRGLARCRRDDAESLPGRELN